LQYRLNRLNQNYLIRQRSFPGAGRPDEHKLRSRPGGQTGKKALRFVSDAAEGDAKLRGFCRVKQQGMMEQVHAARYRLPGHFTI
jgi:hypothetical protein